MRASRSADRRAGAHPSRQGDDRACLQPGSTVCHPLSMHHEFDLIASDGTRLKAWRNEQSDGPRVLVCNGMGVPPQAWPRLIADDCGYTVAGWNHRGSLGSQRPADPARIGIADHVADAVSPAGVGRLGPRRSWSPGRSGVNVAFELAQAHPGPGRRHPVRRGGSRGHLRHAAGAAVRAARPAPPARAGDREGGPAGRPAAEPAVLASCPRTGCSPSSSGTAGSCSRSPTPRTCSRGRRPSSPRTGRATSTWPSPWRSTAGSTRPSSTSR